jgi:hypothetical protein
MPPACQVTVPSGPTLLLRRKRRGVKSVTHWFGGALTPGGRRRVIVLAWMA